MQMSVKTAVMPEQTSPAYGQLLLQDGRRWLSFTDPVRVVSTHEPGEIDA